MTPEQIDDLRGRIVEAIASAVPDGAALTERDAVNAAMAVKAVMAEVAPELEQLTAELDALRADYSRLVEAAEAVLVDAEQAETNAVFSGTAGPAATAVVVGVEGPGGLGSESLRKLRLAVAVRLLPEPCPEDVPPAADRRFFPQFVAALARDTPAYGSPLAVPEHLQGAARRLRLRQAAVRGLFVLLFAAVAALLLLPIVR